MDAKPGSWLDHIFWPVVSAVAGATGATLARHAWEKRLGPSHGVPHPLLADTLGARLLASTLALLPTQKTVLRPPNLQLDAVLGGPTPGRAGSWRYWSTGDHPPGGVLASYLVAKAGWPKDMSNRAEDDAWAPGDGFEPGADVAKALSGARARGWLVTPVFSRDGGTKPETAGIADALDAGLVLGEAFGLEPGDYVALAAVAGGAANDVGIVLEVGNDRAKGTRTIVLAEGCKTDGGGPCARWSVRTFRDDGTLAGDGGDLRVLWVIRPT